MDPTTAILGAVAGAGTTGLLNFASAQSAADYQRYGARHAHRWEVDDLRKAGLNPILSVNRSGVTPTGMSASSTPDISHTVSTALAAQRQRAEIELLHSQIRKTNADAANVEKTVPISEMEADVASEAKSLYERIKSVATDNDKSIAEKVMSLLPGANTAREISTRVERYINDKVSRGTKPATKNRRRGRHGVK